MFAGFTDRLNFGMGNGGGGTVSVPSAFPVMPIGQLGNYNTYAINFISAAQITDPIQQAAINQLAYDLVNSGLMNKMFAVYPFVGGTADSHKWNLKDPRDADKAFRLTFAGAGTHSSTGYLSNISNGYANTYLVPQETFSATNNHLSVYNRSTVAGSNVRANIASANSTSIFNQLYSGHSFYSGNGTTNTGGFLFQTTLTVQGHWIGVKASNSQRFGFRNGVLNTGVTSNNDATLNYTFPLFIGARNTAGTATAFAGHEIAFVSIGSGLTQDECALLYTIVQTFQTTLGRQV